MWKAVCDETCEVTLPFVAASPQGWLKASSIGGHLVAKHTCPDGGLTEYLICLN